MTSILPAQITPSSLYMGGQVTWSVCYRSAREGSAPPLCARWAGREAVWRLCMARCHRWLTADDRRANDTPICRYKNVMTIAAATRASLYVYEVSTCVVLTERRDVIAAIRHDVMYGDN